MASANQSRRVALLSEGRERLIACEPVARALAALAALPASWPPALQQALEFLAGSARELEDEELGRTARLLLGLPNMAAPVRAEEGRRRVQALAAGVEKMRRLLEEALAVAGPLAPSPAADLVEISASCPESSQAAVMAVPAAALAQAREQGLRLWALWLESGSPPASDPEARRQFLTDLDSLGVLLFSDLERGSGPWRHCLLASVLEDGQMVAEALEAPSSRVIAVDFPQRPLPMPPPESSPAEVQAPPLPSVSPPRPAAAPSPATDSGRADSIRVQVGLIDRLIALAGELVLSRNQLKRLLGDDSRRTPGLGLLMQGLGQVTSQVQQNIMLLRMQPLNNLLGRFPRVVRELARQTGKEAELTLLGGEVELDKSILEKLSDPLTHLLRNCLDHGLEPPSERVRLGKPRVGQVVIMAFQEEGMVNIAVHDDGRGIDAEAVAAKAVTAGLVGAEEVRRLSVGEKLAFITQPGISTAAAVTDLSGRGVGMDVAAFNIARLGGTLAIESEPGLGATIRLRLPLTLAIIPSLVVGSSGQVFAIPQADVAELMLIQQRQRASRIEVVGGAPVVRLRERLLPLVRLADVLGLSRRFADPVTGETADERRQGIADRRSADLDRAEEEEETPEETARRAPQTDRRRRRSGDINIAVLRAGVHRYGLIVDHLFDTEEIVVKPLPRLLKDCRCFGGATIMGDGGVAMILDARGIARQASLRFGEISAREQRQARERARARAESDRPKTSLLLFRHGDEDLMALPLAEVARLVRAPLDAVRMVGGRPCLAHQGGVINLLPLERCLPVQPPPAQAGPAYAVLPRAGEGTVGLVASEVLDIVEVEMDLRPYPGPQRGVRGLCDVGGRLALVLEPRGLLEALGGDRPQETQADDASATQPELPYPSMGM